jgi:putative hydrolase of the HAD superfamily
MPNYRAVFFDAGETLVHPHPSFPELLTQVLAAEGHEITPDAIRRSLPPVAERFDQAASAGELWSTSAERSREFWTSVYRILLGGLGIPFGDELAMRLYETFTDLSNYRLFPDAVPTLERLHAEGLALGVISNFEEWLERLLAALDVARFFQVRVISGIEGMEKPDPRIFQLAMDRLGVAPEESVYVGDSPAFDIDPAAGLGMLAVLIDRRDRFPDHPGPRIAGLEELADLIGVPA